MPGFRKLWLALRFSALTALPAAAAAPYALPADAAITVGTVEIDPAAGAEGLFCPSWRLTARGVRARFRHYHLVTHGELHDFYLYPRCWIDGTVVVAGKTFHWQVRPGNTLSTDWPDGVEKMLGGKHSDDPSRR